MFTEEQRRFLQQAIYAGSTTLYAILDANGLDQRPNQSTAALICKVIESADNKGIVAAINEL